MQQLEEKTSNTAQLNGETHHVTFLIVGGGIAGVSCAEMLAICCPEKRTLLLTESSVIKTVANLEPVARYLHKFDVKERSALSSGDGEGNGLAPCIVTIVDKLESINSTEKYIVTRDKRVIYYSFLCLCTGGRPKMIADNDPHVLGIRDTDSVLELQKRLQNAKTIVLLGNGGIASELAYELKNVQVHWVVKDSHVSSTFVDPGAAHFFLKSQNSKIDDKAEGEDAQKPNSSAIKRLRYAELLPQAADNEAISKHGPALGPDWHRTYELCGAAETSDVSSNLPIIHYKATIQKYEKSENALQVVLSTGETINCDFIVSATGVEPKLCYDIDKPLNISPDGGISVDALMRSSIPGIYAAGDVCTATWPLAPHWFQMRLWTQARQMGAMTGRSMAADLIGETIYQDFSFELFGHVTQLFGYQVVLLGRFNGQGLGTDYELLLRSTPGKEYIKFVLQNGRLLGAILIGNTELAETCENLILNGIDLTPFGDDILNPDIDIEDYFD